MTATEIASLAWEIASAHGDVLRVYRSIAPAELAAVLSALRAAENVAEIRGVETEATSVKEGTPPVDPTTTIAALQRENARLTAERDEYKKRAEFLKRQLDRLLDQLKTPREHVDRAQIQLAFDALSKELLGLIPPPDPSASAADSAEEGKEEKGKKKARKHTPHGRAVLPEHLPVVTLVITPTPLPENATKIREEVSFRLGFRRAGFYRLKVVRPVYSVSADDAAACDGTKAELVEGEIASAPTPATNPSDAAEHVDVPSHDAPMPTTVAPDERTVICAPAPHEMIERGLPSADLLAHIVTGKFADKLPYRRHDAVPEARAPSTRRDAFALGRRPLRGRDQR